MLGIKAIRIDIDPGAKADLTMDLTKWDEATAAEVKRLAGVTQANRKRAIIWASPPCTEYSRLMCSRPRNLQAADACVAIIARIATDLDAVVVLIENPATGLLKDRDVIAPYPHSYQLDYCQYGYGYRKRTMIWSSLPLPASFQPKLCPGYPGCPCMFKNPETGAVCHIINMCTDESLAQRISVPDQLASLVGRALAELLPPLAHEPRPPPTPTERRRAQRSWEVDFVEEAVMHKGQLWLWVHWVGHDEDTWETIDSLDAHPGEYEYLSLETRQWVVERYEALQQEQQRKRDLQGQQQGRVTRSRSGAGSSGSSSSSSTKPLLKDGVSG